MKPVGGYKGSSVSEPTGMFKQPSEYVSCSHSCFLPHPQRLGFNFHKHLDSSFKNISQISVHCLKPSSGSHGLRLQLRLPPTAHEAGTVCLLPLSLAPRTTAALGFSVFLGYQVHFHLKPSDWTDSFCRSFACLFPFC